MYLLTHVFRGLGNFDTKMAALAVTRDEAMNFVYDYINLRVDQFLRQDTSLRYTIARINSFMVDDAAEMRKLLNPFLMARPLEYSDIVYCDRDHPNPPRMFSVEILPIVVDFQYKTNDTYYYKYRHLMALVTPLVEDAIAIPVHPEVV